MIELHNIHFSYKKKKPLLQGIHLDLDPGVVYGLFGLNGEGKSTLLRLLQGLLFPKKGNIIIEGYQPKRRQVTFLQKVFLLPENHVKGGQGTLGKFKSIYAPFYPNFSNEQYQSILSQFGLHEKLRFAKLSTGELKKAWLSFALASNTPILLLDEPTNGLDIPSKTIFRRLLADTIDDDRTILIATHQIRDVHHLIDHFLMLKEGQMVFDQSLLEIQEHFHFEIVRKEPDPATYLYYERVPGGYFTLSKSNGYQESLDPDLEFLFNAINAQPSNFISKAQKVNSHA